MLKRDCLHWLATVAFTAICLLARTAHAQVGTAVLTGTVVDTTDKKPVADAVVTATSPAAQGEQIVVTDSAGLYRIPSLPIGKYTLRVEKDTYKPYLRDGIMLRADSTIRVNVELLPEALKGEAVTVVARPPTVDVGSSTTSTSISSEFTHRIPMSRPGGKGAASRSFESVAEAAPGARNDTYGTSISGTTSPENQYVLDGMSVNNPAFGIVGTPLTMEFVKEVNVVSGGYMPEYGRSTGGVLTVVTKSGSNEFHGSVFGFYSPGALEGRKALVKREGTTVQSEQTLSGIGDVGADVGGPIIKDKLWFYAGFDLARTRYTLSRTFNRRLVNPDGSIVKDEEGLTVTEQIPGSEQSWPAYSQSIQAMGKLTYAIDPNHQVALSVYVTPTSSGGRNAFSLSSSSGQPEVTPQTNILGTPDTLGHVRRNDPIDVNLKFTDAFANKRVMLDTTLGWHHETNSLLASDGTRPSSFQGLSNVPRVTWRRTNPHPLPDFEPDVLQAPGGCEMVPVMLPSGAMSTVNNCPVPSYFTGGPAALSESQLNRYQGRSVLTILLQGAGHHVVKAGVDLELMKYDNLRANSGGVGYREATNGNTFTQLSEYGFITGPDQIVHLDNLHAKTQSLTVGGFIQDSWSILDKVTLNAGVRYDAQYLYSNTGDRSLSLPNQWSPRAGVIYDPTQSGRSKIFANYARFYENVPLDIADRSLSGEAVIQSVVGAGRTAAPCGSGRTLGPCIGEHRDSYTAPNLKYSTIGAGPQVIDPDIRPQASDEIVFGAEYEILRDTRLGVSYSKRWMHSIIEDMSRDEARTYFLGNPGEGIAKDFPKAERNYDAGTLYLTKVFADDWLAQASYTLSYLRGNYVGLFRPENLQLDPNINSDFDLRSLLANRTGPLNGDRRHQIKVFLAKDWRLTPQHYATTGLGGRAHSGDPTSYLGGHPVYGADQAYILPRGSGERLPWEFGADLQLGYRFHIDKDKTVQATIDIFNLFNFQAAVQRDERYTIANVLPVVNGDLASLKHADGTPFVATGAGDERNPNFGRVTLYQPPRIFRFGLRVTF
ncbi:MAG TPA: TonB-dependent receptor [Polyangiaceae bacterium]|nr:TonB-dependent receptor [Polyangiaceae bacterium]